MAIGQAALFSTWGMWIEGGKLWLARRQPSPTPATGLIAISVPKTPCSYMDLPFDLCPESY